MIGTCSRSILTGLTKETHSPLPDDKVGEEAETGRIYRFGEGTPQVGNWISEEGNLPGWTGTTRPGQGESFRAGDQRSLRRGRSLAGVV